MDFKDSPEDARYRAQVREWLGAHAPKHGFPLDPEAPDYLRRAKAWQAEKAAAGYACITWPKAWGGQGGTPIQNVIYSEEEASFHSPVGLFSIGLGMCLPTIIAVGDEATKARFVGPALRGGEVWCQLFSEPSGGSDLAAVRTRAVRAADGSGDWIINGQKVWTTGAQHADFGIILTRTDPAVPKHKGMTMFWVDMHDPGVEVRPIHQMSGGSKFNEVFLTDVRVKDGQRLGAVGDGWKVSLVTLMNERLSVSGGGHANWSQFMQAARDTPADGGRTALQDPALREKLADWYVLAEGVRHVRNRTMTALSRGQTPGPEGSIGKLVLTSYIHDMANQAVEMLDLFGVIDDPEAAPAHRALHAALLTMPGIRLGGGTDEILRNIIAERVLGLPGEIRIDKDVAFQDLPAGR
jgi:alkylation response protein AidB-like acyl-CoA dehydrogenase